MTQNDKLNEAVDLGHPWVSPLATIGSNATMYISIIFMKNLFEGDEGYSQQELLI
jgi:hypothetical protein